MVHNLGVRSGSYPIRKAFIENLSLFTIRPILALLSPAFFVIPPV